MIFLHEVWCDVVVQPWNSTGRIHNFHEFRALLSLAEEPLFKEQNKNQKEVPYIIKYF